MDAPLKYGTPYKASDFPRKDQKLPFLSDNVLIDVDGWRTTFIIGYYHFNEKRWYAVHGDQDAIDQEKMIWQYLPLAKYNSSN